MTRALRPGVLVLLVLGAASATAFAADGPRGAPSDAPFWQDVSRPGLERSQDLFRQAIAHLDAGLRRASWQWETMCGRALALPLASDSEAARAGRMRALAELARHHLERQAHLESAIDRLDRALALDPDAPALLHARARALSYWEQPGPVWTCRALRRTDEAIAVLRRLTAADPAFRANTVAFDLAILLAHEHRFGDAAIAYERAIALSLDEREAPMLRGNLAEMKMLAGELEEAIAHYERAIALSTDERSQLLARWGLAVALDRLGEHERALAEVRPLARADEMRVLRSDGVFYEPAHEIHYYDALGHETLADDDAHDRETELELAKLGWGRYLEGAGVDGAFADTARRNLQRVEKLLASTRRRPFP